MQRGDSIQNFCFSKDLNLELQTLELIQHTITPSVCLFIGRFSLSLNFVCLIEITTLFYIKYQIEIVRRSFLKHLNYKIEIIQPEI